MERINIKDVVPGMILAEDVFQNDRILLGAGVVLDKKLIQILEKRNIEEVLVEIPKPEEEEEEKEETKVESEEKNISYPHISIFISKDNMKAYASIEPQTPEDVPLKKDYFEKILNDAGVIHGLMEKEINGLIEKFNSIKRKLIKVQIAKGSQPLKDKEGDLEILFNHINNKDDYKKVKAAKYAEELPDLISSDMEIKENTTIAKRKENIPGTPGMDVLGNELKEDEIIKTPIRYTSEIKKEETSFISTQSGIICFVDNTLSVLPISFEPKPEEQPKEEEEPENQESTQEIEKEKTPPKITVDVSSDKMEATVTIEPVENTAPIKKEDIEKTLLSADIAVGFMVDEIEKLVTKFNKSKTIIKNYKVAKGSNPIPGEEGGLEIKVSHIKDSETYSKIKDIQYANEAPDIIEKGYRVNKGDVIAIKNPDIPPMPGNDVYGNMLETNEKKTIKLEIDNNITENKDEHNYTSKTTGITCWINKKLFILPLCFDARPVIKVSEDKTMALLSVIPPAENGNALNRETVDKILADKNICFGVITSEIDRVINNAENKNYLENIVIAKGVEAINGSKGSVEFLIDISGTPKPTILEDGTADYKNVKLIQSVKKGQELATLIAPTKGKDGIDVFNNKIPHTDGEPSELPAGINTTIKKDNEKEVLVSTVKGNARLNGEVIDVEEGLAISGDVDFSTGNIEYTKSVIVKGDVKSGFKVKVGSDLDIGGTVEDAQIECGGNILIKQGFTGEGKGIINVKKNISITFMWNQEVKAGEDILIARESIGSKLWSRNKIEVQGKPFSIMGGKTTARNEISAYAIGSNNGVRTIVEVGADFVLLDERNKINHEIKELDTTKTKVEQVLQKSRTMNARKKFKQENDPISKKIMQLEEVQKKATEQIEILKKNKDVLTKKIKDVKGATIKVQSIILPGTVIKIGDKLMVVHDEIIGPKTIRLIDGAIRIT